MHGLLLREGINIGVCIQTGVSVEDQIEEYMLNS